MTQEFTAGVWREGERFVAQCHEVDVASQGHPEEEALENLTEAPALHFEPPRATALPSVRRIKVGLHAA